VLEAMACAVPALASSACGNAEVIEHTADGYLAPLNTAGELKAELIAKLQDPASLVKLGANARRKVEQNFSIHRMVKDYAALYLRLAKLR
jgi:glycosyltransferase involved in cell wall biosynthesis